MKKAIVATVVLFMITPVTALAYHKATPQERQQNRDARHSLIELRKEYCPRNRMYLQYCKDITKQINYLQHNPSATSTLQFISQA